MRFRIRDLGLFSEAASDQGDEGRCGEKAELLRVQMEDHIEGSAPQPQASQGARAI